MCCRIYRHNECNQNNKFNKGIGEFTGADDSVAVSSVSMDLDENSYCFYTENDDGTVTVTGIDTVDYYNDFKDEVVDDTYNFYFNIPSEINGKTVTAIGKSIRPILFPRVLSIFILQYPVQ